MNPHRSTSEVDATYLGGISLPQSQQEQTTATDEITSGDQSQNKKTVRVLHVINGEHFAGAERVQDLLAGRLGRFGYEVGFACLKPGEFLNARRYTDAPLYETPMHGRFDFSAARRLSKIIKDESYQIIHSHSVRSAMVALLAATWTGLPLVHHVHSPVSRDTEHRWRSRINALAERLYLTRADRLITVSQSLARHVAAMSPRIADRIAVVPNGVPCRPLIPHQPPIESSNQPTFVGPLGRAWIPGMSDGINYFGITNDLMDATYFHLPTSSQTELSSNKTWTLGTVALFRPRKGIETLLHSLVLLKKSKTPVRLLAVGGFISEEYENETKELAERLDVADLIEWTGFTRDVDAELARMDAFVLPSLYGEGLPMVVLEAMAVGLPVIATDVEGIPEAIRDGHDGLIARPADPDDLAEKVETLISGRVDYHTMQLSAQKRQATMFSEDSMARGVARVYDQLLEKNN